MVKHVCFEKRGWERSMENVHLRKRAEAISHLRPTEFIPDYRRSPSLACSGQHPPTKLSFFFAKGFLKSGAALFGLPLSSS